MKNYFLLSLLLSISLVGFSQDYWEHIYTNDTNSVLSLKVANNGTIYFGGEKGLYISHDGGLSWDFKYLYDYVWLNSIEFDTDSNLLVGASYLLHKYYVEQDSFALIETPPPIVNFITMYVDSNCIFMNGINNHVLRYENEEWTSLDLGGGVGYVYSIVKDTNGILYVGATSFNSGGGVFRSLDNGNNWESFGLQYYYIRSLAIDSRNRLYAGAIGHSTTGEGGFFRYNYENLEWDTISHSAKVQSLYFNEEDSLYAGIYSQGGNGGAWMSPDYGDTWIKISSGLPTITSNNVSDITEDSQGYLYAIVGFQRSIYKSADSTITSIKMPIITDWDDILVYPIPFEDSFFIKNIAQQAFTKPTVSLYDLAGKKQCIKVIIQDNNCLKIVPEDLIPDGVYFVVVESGKDKYFQKLVKH